MNSRAPAPTTRPRARLPERRSFATGPGGDLSSVALVVALTIPFACGEPKPFVPDSPVRVVAPPAPLDGECPAADQATYGPLLFNDGTPTKVRITYLQPGPSSADADDRLLCDIVLDYGAPPPFLAVPSEGLVDVAIEFFSAGGQLMATGMAKNVDLQSGLPAELVTLPVSEFTCTGDHLAVPRAFHSATPLADGRVLITGGGVADPADTRETALDVNVGLYLTNAVELYDPQTGLFTPLSVPDLAPRAMHTTTTWAEGEDIYVALVGGFTMQDLGSPGIVPNQDGLRWAPAFAARGTATEVLVIGPGDTVTRIEGAGDVPAVMSGHSTIVDERQVHVGGQAWVTDPDTLLEVLVGIDEFTATDTSIWEEEVAPTALLQSRRGATVTLLGAGRALVWGGHLEAQAPEILPFAGEMITGLNGQNQPGSQQLTFNSGAWIPRAMHHAVRADNDVFVIGGFDITNGFARTTADVLVERISVDPQDPVVAISPVNLANGDTPTPAGYLGVTEMASGDVLISGGNPDVGYPGCYMNQDGIMCSISDTYLLRTDATSLQPLDKPLVRSRYGHQSVQMTDGRVLVTGGLYAPAPNPELYTVGSAEVLDLRDTDVDVLSPGLTRPPAQIASTPEGEPRAACQIIEPTAGQ